MAKAKAIAKSSVRVNITQQVQPVRRRRRQVRTRPPVVLPPVRIFHEYFQTSTAPQQITTTPPPFGSPPLGMYTAPLAPIQTPIDLTRFTPVRLTERFKVEPVPNTFTPAPRPPGFMETLASETKRRLDRAIAEGHVDIQRR